MKQKRKLRAVSLGLILCAIVIGAAAMPAGLAAAPTAGAAVVGLGFWGAVGCIACIAGFAIGAGATIAGMAAFLAANPELAILCASTCVLALAT